MKKNVIIIVLALTNIFIGVFAYNQKTNADDLQLLNEQYRKEAMEQRLMAEKAMQEAMLQQKLAHEHLMLAEQQKKIAVELASRKK
jgi:hypothetical protein